MTMVPIPAGEFTMGTKAEDALAACQEFSADCQLDWFKNEEPPHHVYLDAYWIDQTEVTNRMSATFLNLQRADATRASAWLAVWELAMIIFSMFHGKVSWIGNLTLHESDEQSHLHQQS
jgi:formylglycine-generating enzyme required for sulfatase activity